MLSRVKRPTERNIVVAGLEIVFLHKISFVNVDFMSIVGAQCVIDVDFRFSMLVSLCIPLCVLTLIVLAYLAGQYKISRTTKKLTIESKKKLMGKLFDMSDVDLSGELDAEEFIQMVEFVARRKVVREIRSLSESHVHRIMLRAGAQLPRRSHDPMLLKRADFIESPPLMNRKTKGLSLQWQLHWSLQRLIRRLQLLNHCFLLTMRCHHHLLRMKFLSPK